MRVMANPRCLGSKGQIKVHTKKHTSQGSTKVDFTGQDRRHMVKIVVTGQNRT